MKTRIEMGKKIGGLERYTNRDEGEKAKNDNTLV